MSKRARSTSLTITIPGPPRAWKRTNSVDGKRLMSKKARQEKRHARLCLRAALLLAEGWDFTQPVTVEAHFYQRRKPAAVPDCDNLFKLIGDAGNGLLWKDDAQIVRQVAQKHDVRVIEGKDALPYTVVHVEAVDGE